MSRTLFVCSGNICRSPMAAGFAGARGVDFVASAGTIAIAGSPATPHAVAVMAELDIDIGGHRATDVWSLDLAETTVYALARRHVDALADFGVDATLLDPSGRSIPDPYGQDLAAYRHVRDLIDGAVSARFESQP